MWVCRYKRRRGSFYFPYKCLLGSLVSFPKLLTLYIGCIARVSVRMYVYIGICRQCNNGWWVLQLQPKCDGKREKRVSNDKIKKYEMKNLDLRVPALIKTRLNEIL